VNVGRWSGAAIALLLVGCPSSETVEAPRAEAKLAIPTIDTASMEPRVARRVEEALAAVRDRPGAALSWGELGSVCHAHEIYRCAETGYAQAATLAGADFRWPYLLGIVRELLGDEDADARGHFEQAVLLKPNYPPAHFRLGETLMREGDLDAARAAYSRALEIDPRMAVARRGLGQALIASGEPEAAQRQLLEVIEETGGDAKSYAALAQALARLGQRERAEEASRRAAASRGSIGMADPVRLHVSSLGISSRHCFERARQLMQQGQFESALAQLRIVEEVRPDDAALHHYLGGALARLNAPERARQHLEKAVELDPKLAGASGELGALLLQQGDAAAAIPHLLHLLELRPEFARGHDMLAQAYEAVGRAADAKTHRDRAAGLRGR